MSEIKIIEGNAKVGEKPKRCPNCGANDIKHNPKTNKFICNYCRGEFEIAVEKLEGFIDNIGNLKGTVIGEGAQNIDEKEMVTCKCSSCGAEIMLNASEVPFTKCHWCQTPLSLTTKIPNGTIPDAILPFKVSREEAFSDMKKEIEKCNLGTDSNFIKNFCIDNLRGVYFPYIMVDFNAHCKFKGKGKNTLNNEDGESSQPKLYNIEREFDIHIENLTENAKHDLLNNKNLKNRKLKLEDCKNTVISTLLPFDVENCVKLDKNYTVGYSFEKRDVNVEEIRNNMRIKAKDVARHKLNEYIQKFNQGVRWENEEIEIYGEQWKTVYLPVWLYSYTQEVGNGGVRFTYYLAENARTKELNFIVPPSRNFLGYGILASVMIPMILFVLTKSVLLFGVLYAISICIIVGIVLKGTKVDERNRYEKETKSKLTNIKEKDVFIKNSNNSNPIENANNNRIEGDKK